MAKQRVIAYFMHEYEEQAARDAMTDYQETDSFVIGDMDDAQIDAVRAKGVIVEPVKPLPPPADSVPPQPVRRTRAGRLGFEAKVSAEEATPAPVDYYRIRLRGPLIETWRDRLTAAGVKLLDYVTGHGYKARLRIEQIADIRALDFVEAVTWISPKQSAPRIATRARRGRVGFAPESARMLAFDVRLHDAADLPIVETWLKDHNVPVEGSGGRKIRIQAAENAPVLDDIGQLPEVDIVAEYVKPKLFNDFARQLLGIDGAQAHAPVIPQDGSGQIVAVADTGIDEDHPDFKGRIVKAVARGRANDASDPNGHGTHVAGSVLGDGSASNGKIKGAAPKAKLFFQSLLDDEGDLGGLPVDLNELFDEAYKAGARIHNNSWGSETNSMYTMNSEEVDEFVRQHPDMLIVIAAGNEGTAAKPVKSKAGFVDWLSIGSPASCKNALTVGASRSSRTDGAYSTTTWGQGWPQNFPDKPIADEKISGDPNGLAAFSSRGPCDDRRIKPDVVAPGTDILSAKSSKAPSDNFWGPHDDHYAFDGGTSMATPLVAGCAALVRQYYVDDRKHTPSAALLKATIINSTTWLTGTDAIAPSDGKPNYHQGYGRVNMANAIPNPANPQLTLQFVDNWDDKPSQFVRTGQRKRYQFNLANAGELRLCLAYTDRAARGLQNNLNLVLQNVNTSQKWMGNADLPDRLVLPDPDNNVESIRIPNAAAGAYLVQVFVGNLLASPQDFALVVTGPGVSALNEI